MQPMESIKIDLPADLVASMNEAVAAGQYHETSEIVRRALEQWRIRQQILREELGNLWDEGIASGWAEPFTVEDIMEEVRRRRSE